MNSEQSRQRPAFHLMTGQYDEQQQAWIYIRRDEPPPPLELTEEAQDRVADEINITLMRLDDLAMLLTEAFPHEPILAHAAQEAVHALETYRKVHAEVLIERELRSIPPEERAKRRQMMDQWQQEMESEDEERARDSIVPTHAELRTRVKAKLDVIAARDGEVATVHHLNQLCAAIYNLGHEDSSTHLRVRPSLEKTLQAEQYLAWVEQAFLDEVFLVQHADYQIILEARREGITVGDEISRRMFEGMQAFIGRREDWEDPHS